MEKEEREHLVEWLVAFTGWNRQAFEKKSDQEIKDMYEEKITYRHPR